MAVNDTVSTVDKSLRTANSSSPNFKSSLTFQDPLCQVFCYGLQFCILPKQKCLPIVLIHMTPTKYGTSGKMGYINFLSTQTISADIQRKPPIDNQVQTMAHMNHVFYLEQSKVQMEIFDSVNICSSGPISLTDLM